MRGQSMRKAMSVLLAGLLLAGLLPTAALATQIADNPADTTLEQIGVGDTMANNYGTVVTNNGTVTNNNGTVMNNDTFGTVATNNGTVTNNVGTVLDNRALVLDNYGTVTENNGTVTNNNVGTVQINNLGGTVEINPGTVSGNKGTVKANTAAGTVTSNEISGRVEANGGTVTTNYGTVTSNEASGTVEINRGTVHNYGGTVTHNLGAVYEHRKVTVTGGEHAVITGLKEVGGDLWIADSTGTATLTPAAGYRFAKAPQVNPAGATITQEGDGYVLKNVTGDITLILTLGPAVAVVALEANGGSLPGGVTTVTTSPDGKLALPLPVPTRSGHTFLGWFTQQNGGEEVTAGHVFHAGDTVYARWQQHNAPSAPQSLSATPGVKQVALAWAAPASLGGGAILKYEVSSDNGTSWAEASGDASHTFTGLTGGVPYTFQVRAVTDAGPGTAATVTATPLRGGGGGGGSSNTSSPTDEAFKEIEQAKDGDTVKVDLPANGKLPGEILEAAGKDVTLEIGAGNGLTWIINGKDIPQGKLADLNLKIDPKANTIPVTVINVLTGEKKVMQLALSHDGPFPFPLTLRLEVGKESAGLFANLYYYNEANKTMEFQAAAKISAKGEAGLPFTHASSYAVVIDQESHAPVTWENPFTDVKQGDWFYDGVAYVNQAGLMNGTSATTFGPHGPMTRGMFVTALYRLAGSPQDAGEGSAFTDIPSDAYYADAVRWASSKGIVKGATATTFDPDRPVTRQEMAVIMHGYATVMGYELPTSQEAVTFADTASIGSWAAKAVTAMQRAGILNGKDGGRFDPLGTATRAEVAVVFCRFIEVIADTSEV